MSYRLRITKWRLLKASISLYNKRIAKSLAEELNDKVIPEYTFKEYPI